MTITTLTRDLVLGAVAIAALITLTQTAPSLGHGPWRMTSHAVTAPPTISTARGLRETVAANPANATITHARARN